MWACRVSETWTGPNVWFDILQTDVTGGCQEFSHQLQMLGRSKQGTGNTAIPLTGTSRRVFAFFPCHPNTKQTLNNSSSTSSLDLFSRTWLSSAAATAPAGRTCVTSACNSSNGRRPRRSWGDVPHNGSPFAGPVPASRYRRRLRPRPRSRGERWERKDASKNLTTSCYY